MKWIGRRQSDNIIDRRGLGGGLVAGGGILGVIALIASMLFGVDLGGLLPGGGSGSESPPAERRAANPAEEQMKQFTGVVLAETEDVWNELFRQYYKKDYPEPQLVLFTGGDRSGCGYASSAMGPFYCPTDQRIYIDLQFFQDLASRFRAQGDFAQAYVIAHEVGHHVQNQLGILDQVHGKRGRVSETESNQLSVRAELQADFLAGVWAHHTQKMKNILDPDDLDEALAAAEAVGDDRLQKQSRGYVVPDSFTHGSSAQRMKWFKLGFNTGDLSRMMDPFKLPYNQL